MNQNTSRSCWIPIACLGLTSFLAAACGAGSTPASDSGPDANDSGDGGVDSSDSSADSADSSADSSDGGDSNDGGPDSGEVTCPERVALVLCNALPPECPLGSFPAADPSNDCWTGECVDCVDGCQRDDDCTVVSACGCFYHDGCSWVETVFRLAADPQECYVPSGQTCPDHCPVIDCPSDCTAHPERCCSWCAPSRALCSEGSCRADVDEPCD